MKITGTPVSPRHTCARLVTGLIALALLIPSSETATAQRGGLQPLGGIVLEPRQTGDTPQRGPRGRGRRVGLIVRLADPSLADLYAGNGRPAHGRGRGVNVRSAEARNYLASLHQKHIAFERALRGISADARVGQRFGVVLNAVSVSASPESAAAIARLPGVAAVYPDLKREVQTTRSAAFVGAPALWNELGGQGSAGDGVIIGVIDTGVWPEHPSLSNPDQFGTPYGTPEHWNGTECDFGSAHPADPPFACNGKVVGARRFMATYDQMEQRLPDEFVSARDDSGHGTHMATVATGNGGVPAAIAGNSLGTVTGIAPRAHVAAYKVCGANGCYESDAVAAVQQAILDGVDVINFSVDGGSRPYTDPVSLALLDAYNAGIFVATAAGNSGSGDNVGHREPWTTTVGAGTLDRSFQSTLTLRAPGKVLTLTGATITGGIASAQPLVNAADAGDPYCLASMPAGTFAGRIVVCRRGGNARVEKSYNVQQRGALGMILINPEAMGVSRDTHYIPTVHLEKPASDSLLAFLAASNNETASFTRGTASADAGDVMAAFSSRGGANQPLGISKPDVIAPGVQIVAGYTPSPATGIGGPDGQAFLLLEGTSVASAHVAGAAALLKAMNPSWTADHIKSALMLTATPAVKKEGGLAQAWPFDFGSGRIRLSAAGRPGIAMTPAGDEFMTKRNQLWDVNYPAMYLPRMPGAITVRRTLENLEGTAATWNLSVVATDGLRVTVPPNVALSPHGTAHVDIAIDASAIPVDYTGNAWIVFSEAGGTRTLLFPISLVRKPGGVPISTTCAQSAVPLGGSIDCAITVANAEFTPAAVTAYDVLPSGLTLIPGSAANAFEVGNAVAYQGVLPGAVPGTIDVRPGPPYEGFLPLSAYYPPVPCAGSCDDRVFSGTVPQGILYNGTVYHNVHISTNGFIQLDGPTSPSPVNQQLPSPAAPSTILAPFWTDLHPAGSDGLGGGKIYAGYVTYPSVRTWLVIEWRDVLTKGSSAKHTFDIWLQIGGHVEDITFSYETLESLGAGGALTVGAQDSSGTVGKSYYFNGTGTSPVEASNVAVTSPQPAPGGTHTMTFRATGTAKGTWTHCGVLLRDGSNEIGTSCVPIQVK